MNAQDLLDFLNTLSEEQLKYTVKLVDIDHSNDWKEVRDALISISYDPAAGTSERVILIEN